MATLLAACAHHPRNPDAKTVGLGDKVYLKLTSKAHAGNAEAAERLAQLWYQNGEGTAKARYWLEIAARNGSQRAARYQKLASTYLPE